MYLYVALLLAIANIQHFQLRLATFCTFSFPKPHALISNVPPDTFFFWFHFTILSLFIWQMGPCWVINPFSTTAHPNVRCTLTSDANPLLCTCCKAASASIWMIYSLPSLNVYPGIRMLHLVGQWLQRPVQWGKKKKKKDLVDLIDWLDAFTCV